LTLIVILCFGTLAVPSGQNGDVTILVTLTAEQAELLDAALVAPSTAGPRGRGRGNVEVVPDPRPLSEQREAYATRVVVSSLASAAAAAVAERESALKASLQKLPIARCMALAKELGVSPRALSCGE
jgi:hypothetical protein